MKRNIIWIAAITALQLTGQTNAETHTGNHVIISKSDMMLMIVNNMGDTIARYDIACGAVHGNKLHEGDYRTPEGTFSIVSIEDATEWIFYAKDGTGVKNVYGDTFFRLNTSPHTGIGIHGTNVPERLPGRLTMGCIRLRNEDLAMFASMVDIGTNVTILPDISH